MWLTVVAAATMDTINNPGRQFPRSRMLEVPCAIVTEIISQHLIWWSSLNQQFK